MRCASTNCKGSRVGFARVSPSFLHLKLEQGAFDLRDVASWYVEPSDSPPVAPSSQRRVQINVVRRIPNGFERQHPERSWCIASEIYAWEAGNSFYVPLCLACLHALKENKTSPADCHVVPELPCMCCGCCSVYKRNYFDICPVCFWEDDRPGLRPDQSSGANSLTLLEGRENYLKFGACQERFVELVRKPAFENVLCLLVPSSLDWHPDYS